MLREPKVCISVLNWRKPDLTINCIKSVLEIAYTNYEIVMVDNASGDNSVQRITSQFPELTILVNKRNDGYAGGHYLSSIYALENGHELLWIINNDLIVDPKALAAMIRHYLDSPNQVFGSVPFHNGVPQNITLIPLKASKADFHSRLEVSKLFDPDSGVAQCEYLGVAHLNGSSMLVPLDIIARLGFIDRKFFMYAEEVDYCLKCLKNGVKPVLVLSSKVEHDSGGSFENDFELARIMKYYKRRNFLTIIKRHAGTAFYMRLIKTYLTIYLKMLWDGKRIDKYQFLGTIHAIIGLLGKRRFSTYQY